MKNGLAIWHYPHRTVLENVAYFAGCGFESVSIGGAHMYKVCSDKESAERLAHLIKCHNLILTVHHCLPKSHSAEDIASFKDFIEVMSEWQRQHGCLSILSFDVYQEIRDNITPYINYVLETVEKSKIALEDFALNDTEKSQIEHLKGNARFGFLIDVGHLYIRICGKNKEPITLFNNSVQECPTNEKPEYQDFIKAFQSKEFPIFEIHLHNNNGKDDQHLFLEDGTLEIKMIADVLKEIDFDGVLTIESAPGYTFRCVYPESDIRIKQTYSYWKKLMIC